MVAGNQPTDRDDVPLTPDGDANPFSLAGMAAQAARENHAASVTDCSGLSPAGFSKADGTEVVYCANCRAVLLKWGGGGA